MQTSVETIPNYRMAYMRQIGAYGPSNIQVMENLKKWASENNLLSESAILFGIPQDNPQTTPSEKCRYDACIVITEDEQLDNVVCESQLLGGTYVIFKVTHTAEAIQNAWSKIFPTVYGMGYQIDHKPIIERYRGNMINQDFCEICVPIIS